MKKLLYLLLLASSVGIAPAHAAAGIRLLVPMYFYPASNDPQWQAVADAASQVEIVAIVNPGNGLQDELSEGDHENYNEGQNLLHNAGVKMIGYVSSNYGCEPLAEVRQHVDEYFSHASFAYITGIFIDETENDLVNDGGSSPCPGTVDAGFDYQAYYAAIGEHIRSHARFDLIVCNPGTDVPAEYLGICDVIVSFESRGENLEADATGDGQLAADASPENYALLVYDSGVLDRNAVDAWLALAIERNYGYLHFTDDDGWSALPTYFGELVAAVECINVGTACEVEPAEERRGHSGGGAMVLVLGLLMLLQAMRFAHRR